MKIGITGQKRSGKDTVANFLVEHYGFTKIELPAPLTEDLCIINPWCRLDIGVLDANGQVTKFERFADLVARVGIDGAKELSADVRAYQQRFGTDVIRVRHDEDYWVNEARWAMKAALAEAWDSRQCLGGVGRRVHGFVLPNIRNGNEPKLVDVLVRVNRPGYVLDAQSDHAIEHSIEKLTPDHMIENDGSLDDLHKKVVELMEKITHGC